jgi:exodeoxyribonuclease-3
MQNITWSEQKQYSNLYLWNTPMQREHRPSHNLCLISWNINGIRSVYRKGFLQWLEAVAPDILCLQEIRAASSPIDDGYLQSLGYFTYWNAGAKAGYSGTALLSLAKPLAVNFGLGDNKFDREGRTIIAEFPNFTLINCYFPNGNRNPDRLSFKLDFYLAFLSKCMQLLACNHRLIVCGDLNTAHKDIDLAHPESHRKKSGFLPEERLWIDKITEAGLIDTFRYFYPGLSGKYTYWSNTTHSRERNSGWRFDYFFIAQNLVEQMVDAFILSEVAYSDHCPVGIRLKATDG